MAVRYKFRSEQDEHTYKLSGRSVTVLELKDHIYASRKGLEGMDIEIINPSSREAYYDDEALNRGSRVEVRKRPLPEGQQRVPRGNKLGLVAAMPGSRSSLNAATEKKTVGGDGSGNGDGTDGGLSRSSINSTIASMASAAAQKRQHLNSTANYNLPSRPRPRQQRPREPQNTGPGGKVGAFGGTAGGNPAAGFGGNQNGDPKTNGNTYQQKQRAMRGLPKWLLKTVEAGEEGTSSNANGEITEGDITAVTQDGIQVTGIVQQRGKFRQTFGVQESVGQKSGSGGNLGDGAIGSGEIDEFEDDGEHLKEADLDKNEVTARGDEMLEIGALPVKQNVSRSEFDDVPLQSNTSNSLGKNATSLQQASATNHGTSIKSVVTEAEASRAPKSKADAKTKNVLGVVTSGVAAQNVINAENPSVDTSAGSVNALKDNAPSIHEAPRKVVGFRSAFKKKKLKEKASGTTLDPTSSSISTEAASKESPPSEEHSKNGQESTASQPSSAPKLGVARGYGKLVSNVSGYGKLASRSRANEAKPKVKEARPLASRLAGYGPGSYNTGRDRRNTQNSRSTSNEHDDRHMRGSGQDFHRSRSRDRSHHSRDRSYEQRGHRSRSFEDNYHGRDRSPSRDHREHSPNYHKYDGNLRDRSESVKRKREDDASEGHGQKKRSIHDVARSARNQKKMTKNPDNTSIIDDEEVSKKKRRRRKRGGKRNRRRR